METTRRQDTSGFKRDAVALVTEQGYTVTTAARNLGIHAQTPLTLEGGEGIRGLVVLKAECSGPWRRECLDA